MATPKLTASEKVKAGWYVVRMAKRGLADDRINGGRVDQSDLQRKFDRVLDKARKREQNQ